MKTGEVREVMWLRHGEPVPDGWRVVRGRPSHHDRHAVLIERVG